MALLNLFVSTYGDNNTLFHRALNHMMHHRVSRGVQIKVKGGAAAGDIKSFDKI